MNKNDFTELIKQPEKLGNDSIDALKKVVADFPYFSTAQVLLAKALFNTSHFEYEKQLKTTALIAGDRTVLYKFLNNLPIDSDEKIPSITIQSALDAEKISIAEINEQSIQKENSAEKIIAEVENKKEELIIEDSVPEILPNKTLEVEEIIENKTTEILIENTLDNNKNEAVESEGPMVKFEMPWSDIDDILKDFDESSLLENEELPLIEIKALSWDIPKLENVESTSIEEIKPINEAAEIEIIESVIEQNEEALSEIPTLDNLLDSIEEELLMEVKKIEHHKVVIQTILSEEDALADSFASVVGLPLNEWLNLDEEFSLETSQKTNTAAENLINSEFEMTKNFTNQSNDDSLNIQIEYDKIEGLTPGYVTPSFEPKLDENYQEELHSEISEFDFTPMTLDNQTTVNKFNQVYTSEVSETNKRVNFFEPGIKPSPEITLILDKFISESPSINRSKAEFFDPVNVAKQSAEEDGTLVSETLATIYTQQGLFNKAISTYQKLSLIYPDKKSYFAALITKIKAENK